MEDISYIKGYTYSTSYNLTQHEVHCKPLISITTPPNFQAEYADSYYTAKLIPGMIQMVAGVPFMVNIKDKQGCMQTIGCMQTLKLLQHYSDYGLILAACV